MALLPGREFPRSYRQFCYLFSRRFCVCTVSRNLAMVLVKIAAQRNNAGPDQGSAGASDPACAWAVMGVTRWAATMVVAPQPSSTPSITTIGSPK